MTETQTAPPEELQPVATETQPLPTEDPTPEETSNVLPYISPDIGLTAALMAPDIGQAFEALAPLVPEAPKVPQVRARAAPTLVNPLGNPNSEIAKKMAGINTQHGANTVRVGTLLPAFNQISTGVFALDYGLFGGIQEGLAHQIFGWENVGKTSMILRIFRSFQIRYPGKILVFFSLEGTLDPEHAAMFGVDMTRVVVASPPSGEAAVDEIIELYSAEETAAIAVDSIPALVPTAILDKSAEDRTMAEEARMCSTLCKKLIASQANERRRNHSVTVLATNGWRVNPGKMFGDNRYLPGGNFQKYYFTNFIEITAKNETGQDQLGQEVFSQLQQGFNIRKGKAGACLKEAEFISVISNDHPSGLRPGDIDDHATIATIARKHGFIGGSGKGGYTLVAVNDKFKTLEDIKAYLRTNPMYNLGLKQRILADLRKRKGRPEFPPDGYLLNHVRSY